MININRHLAPSDSLYVSTIGENKMTTYTQENIATAISNATVDGNFNSDLIENATMRKLAINQYAKSVINSGADTVLKDYFDTSTNIIAHDDTPQKAVKLDSSTIILGGKTALVIEKSNEYILGKFDNPTFSDKPYFTIGYFDDSYFSGHYDLSLVDATNDFVQRNK